MTTPTIGHHLELHSEAQDLLFRAARTANSFTAAPVSDDQLKAIYDLVKWAPTSANSQPLRLVFLRTPEAKARLLPHMGERNRPKTEAAPVTAILAADHEFDEHLPELFPLLENPRAIFTDPGMRRHTAEFNAALQAGYFLLGVRAAGLAAGPMAGFDRAGVDAEFFPDGRLHSILVVNIGKPGPDAWFNRLPRLRDDQVIQFL